MHVKQLKDNYYQTLLLEFTVVKYKQSKEQSYISRIYELTLENVHQYMMSKTNNTQVVTYCIQMLYRDLYYEIDNYSLSGNFLQWLEMIADKIYQEVSKTLAPKLLVNNI